ncbi:MULTISPECIES: aromatic-ring-hydroxylating dioxygenase subunit beta [unclassified Caballeronia]|uniref:aromatic-ring-hydroxylating dioxygenase subunit beta n=1 Tax=unclassified Caballeronia TaxID=2646786 RepID=UPI002860C706|nr:MULTISPECIES: aromatic-ring-hydroxylating dioxygenase subunit beta [unclassified Caballeronia]MDR5776449.1 aromatic-ring-hydroxylating dioxygenase subunit beta [Caballeronia sp. LZ002]MDR5806627.1 aromatic-ring-hydroxylating dioxygenase subunit beta [Caballeronia sp. LZ001]MDR5851769.1 aromatic-ring-hydroxylating dioxygenase subunit beta [Caballeronia sp. LZ003]
MNANASSIDSAIKFIYREARLLDERRFDEWHKLFTEDGVYWMPTGPSQTDSASHATLINEDRGMLKLRIDRLKQPPCSSTAA